MIPNLSDEVQAVKNVPQNLYFSSAGTDQNSRTTMVFSCLRGLLSISFITLIPFIILLLAVIGTYLYNDQEVLVHMRAYLRNVAPTMDPKSMSNLIDVIQKRQAIGILRDCRIGLVLHVGFHVPADSSQYRVPGGETSEDITGTRR